VCPNCHCSTALAPKTSWSYSLRLWARLCTDWQDGIAINIRTEVWRCTQQWKQFRGQALRRVHTATSVSNTVLRYNLRQTPQQTACRQHEAAHADLRQLITWRHPSHHTSSCATEHTCDGSNCTFQLHIFQVKYFVLRYKNKTQVDSALHFTADWELLLPSPTLPPLETKLIATCHKKGLRQLKSCPFISDCPTADVHRR